MNNSLRMMTEYKLRSEAVSDAQQQQQQDPQQQLAPQQQQFPQLQQVMQQQQQQQVNIHIYLLVCFNRAEKHNEIATVTEYVRPSVPLSVLLSFLYCTQCSVHNSTVQYQQYIAVLICLKIY
jgi:hypothetical protein